MIRRFPDGNEQLSLYFKLHAIDKISSEDSKALEYAALRFTINEDGGIASVKIHETSGNPEIDHLLLDAVKNMPAWNPAVDSKGQKVRQEFELLVSNGSEGC